jgi:hypothetical protein
VVFIFFFLIAYSLGFSAVHITMNCKLYPPLFLPTGCAVAATSNLISSIAVSFVFLYLSQWLEAGSFYLFTLFCADGAFVGCRFGTKGQRVGILIIGIARY